MQNKDKSFTIIGAGPAGLSCAEALREKGYHNITILEKSSYVGGKTKTNIYTCPKSNSSHVYEIGAIQPYGGAQIRKLLKKYNILQKTRVGQSPLRLKVIDTDNNDAILDFKKYSLGMPIKFLPLILKDVVKITKSLLRYTRLAKPGYQGFKYSAELAIPYPEWISKIKLSILELPLIYVIGPFFTFANSPHQHSALRFIKQFFEVLKPPAYYLHGILLPISGGYQRLWQNVAANFDIRFKSDIKKIHRSTNNVKIELRNGETIAGDTLIIACPPKQLLSYMNNAEAEGEIFFKYYTYEGVKATFVGQGSPEAAMLFSANNENLYGVRGLVTEGELGDGRYLYSILVAGNVKNFEENKKNIENLIYKNLEIKIEDWINFRHWPDYNPGFSVSDLKEGVYEKLENLQGKNNTYYTGELWSEGSNSLVVSYSYDLVKRFW